MQVRYYFILFFLFSFLSLNIFSTESFDNFDEGEIRMELLWQKPDKHIEDIFNREYQPVVSFLSKKDKKIYHDRSVYIPLEWLAEPVVQYAGIEIYEKSRARPRSSFLTSFKIADLFSDDFTEINLPKNSAFGHEVSSYDESAFLVFEYKYDKIVLWHVDTYTLETKILLDGGISQALSNTLLWFPDNENVLINIIPETLKKPERTSNIPVGPIVMETSGRVSQNRTFPNLLQNSFEEDLFEYYTTTQLVKLNTKTGEYRNISSPGMISSSTISPDGKYILVREYLRPFSGKVPYFRFPYQWYVYDISKDRKVVLDSHGLTDYLKPGMVQTGKRWFTWHPFEDASLLYLRALDDGTPDKQVKYRDELRILKAPFTAKSRPFLRVENRLKNILFADKDIYFYEESEWKSNTVKAYFVNKNKKHELWNRHQRAIYNQPGNPLTIENEKGQTVLLLKDNNIFLVGDGLSRDGRKPFIDSFNVINFTSQRLIQFDEEDFISIGNFYNNNPQKIIVYRQNRTTPSNIFIYDNNDKSYQAITNFVDTIPELTKLQKRIIRYKRDDGVELSGILYLPENYDGSKRLPLLMSAYPREFADAETASQASLSDNRYVRPYGSSNFYLCLDDVAVLTNASFPIIGDAETVNNTFMQQAVSNAKAAIDYLSEEGIIDPDKAVIYGHSYGAFMVANLLAHSDLFAGGIAQNGAYNRTLTPFGFQSERRSLWQAKDVYLNLSPFLYANQINKPLLLIHSTEDTNSGTYPIQSRRLFEALEGNGKDCRYIQLPLEGHSYKAKETHLHLLWEYKKFFDEKIRN